MEVIVLQTSTAPQAQDELETDPLAGVVNLDRARQLRDQFGILAPEDLADMIGVDVRTLATWRAQKRGPDAVRAGRAVFYRRKDIDEWLALNVVPMDRAA
jgi:hypothetical protein